MVNSRFALSRRHLLAATGATLLAGGGGPVRAANPPVPFALVLKPGTIALRPGQPDSAIWMLDVGTAPLRFKRGDELAVTFTNQTSRPAALSWHGLDGVPAAEPLIGRPLVPPDGRDSFTVPLRHAGTLLCEARLPGDPDSKPSLSIPIVVTETAPPTVDRDEVVLIEDWRLEPNGQALAVGRHSGVAKPLYTFNGKLAFDIIAKPNDRLRLRFINGSQNTVIAIKIDTFEVRVMAIDSQPSEPFLARDGVLAMAPGTRIDCFVDAAAQAGATAAVRLATAGSEPIPIGKITTEGATVRPAPLPIPPPLLSNGLPEKLNLAAALRIDLPLTSADWLMPAAISATSKPAFRVKRGRTVVLAVTNAGATPAVFRLHGHHVRLLDRLDDGWKPFWLDTLAVAAGQTQRLAFAAENPGAYLIESMATDWAAPRMLRSYVVE